MACFSKASLVTRLIFGTDFRKALGQGSSLLSIITSVILAVTFFFYIFTVGSYFKVSIHILQNRVIYDIFFSNIYIINKYADHLIIASGIILWLFVSVKGKWRFPVSATYAAATIIGISASSGVFLDVAALTSFPIAISFLVYNRFASKKILIARRNLSGNYLAILGLGIAIAGIIISSAPVLFSVSAASIPVHNYAFDIFLLFSSFSPIVMFLLISCLPVKLLMNYFTNKLLRGERRKGAPSSLPVAKQFIKTRAKIGYLLLFMMLSVSLALIPHQPTINKDNHLVGVDTRYYVKWINILLHSEDPQKFLRQAFVVLVHGDRPVTLIVLFIIAKIVNANIFYTFDRMPIILGPILVLVVYFLTRELTSNTTTSLVASFLTAISFQTLIGIYAGFYANWFALMIGYLSFVFLFRFLKKPSKLNFVIYSTLMVLLLFSHVYTWTILTIVMVIFLAVMLKMNYYKRKSIFLLFFVIMSSVVIDVARTTMTGSSSGIEQDIQIANQRQAGLTQFALRWNNLVDTTQHYFGNLFSNFIILVLGIYWLFRCNLQQTSTIFLVSFLSTGILPIFFGNSDIQSRVFYDVPLQIPAAIALTYIKRDANASIVFLPICLWLLAMSVRAVSNFYLIPPS
jgi:hypothetical protein